MEFNSDDNTEMNPVVSLEQVRRDKLKQQRRKSVGTTTRIEELERVTDQMTLELFDLKRDHKQLQQEFNLLLKHLKDRLK